MKLDVTLAYSVHDAAVRARQLEAVGVDGVFSFENAHDVFFPLVAAAPVCNLELTTNVAMALPRSPMHLAVAANDLQVLSKGRFRLGLGSQIRPHIEKRYGSRWIKPVAQMREWVEAIRAIFTAWEDGTRLDYRGQYTTHTLMTPNFVPPRHPYGRPPILVGALGPKMNEMAAEVADGILVMPFNSQRHMAERTMPAIRRGLTTARRSATELEITAEVIVGVGRTDQELEQAMGLRSLLAFYGSTPSYRPVLEVEGWGSLQDDLNVLSKQGRWAEMTALITDEMVNTLAVHGTPQDCAAEIVRRYGADAARVCAYFPGYDVDDEVIGEFADALRRLPRPAAAPAPSP